LDRARRIPIGDYVAEIDVIRIRNKADPDPTRFYDFNSLSDYLHFCSEQKTPDSVAIDALKKLERGEIVDGKVFGEPGLFLQGTTTTINDREIIL